MEDNMENTQILTMSEMPPGTIYTLCPACEYYLVSANCSIIDIDMSNHYIVHTLFACLCGAHFQVDLE